MVKRLSPDVLAQIEAFVMAEMASVSADLRIAHDYNHVNRVRGWAMLIAETDEFARLDLVEAAALLHDVGLAHVTHRRDHAAKGAVIATRFLARHAWLSADEIAEIAEAIRCHSGLTGGGWLGEIVRDADMLDLFGATGVMRAVAYTHQKA